MRNILLCIIIYVQAMMFATGEKMSALENKSIANFPIAGISMEEYEIAEEILFDEKCIDGWVTGNINVREEPDISSEILDTLVFNRHIRFAKYNDEWNCIFLNEEKAYISSRYVSEEKAEYKEYRFKCGKFKSFMPYTAISSKNTPQYKLQEIYAYTGTYGIRQVNGRYCVAIGTAFNAKVGTYFDIMLENGREIPCIVGDIKSNLHTGADNIYTKGNGCASEFITDFNSLNESAKRTGNISQCSADWDSGIVGFRIYNKNILERR